MSATSDLYVRMYDEHEGALAVWDGGHWLSRKTDGIEIHGAMTNNAKASYLVEIVYNITLSSP